MGASLDYGWTNFNGNSQIGTFGNDNNSFPIIGYPYIVDEPGSYLTPVMVQHDQLYTGLYALDTFNATDRLTLTGGARFNFAGIDLEGANGALLNGYSTFFHLNPTVGLTYKITPDISFYAGYAMSNRAPTPLELGCADPSNPCIIDNFLVSDPKLNQVVGNTFELGFRGRMPRPMGPPVGQAVVVGGALPHDAHQRHPAAAELRHRLWLLRQRRDDLAPGRGGERPVDRRPVERLRQLHLYRRRLSDDFHGAVAVQSAGRREWRHSDHQWRPIAGIPKNTVKVGFDYSVTDKWKVGADMVAASGQALFGNENGALPQVPGYAIFGLHTSYQIGKQLQVYGLIQNLFDRRFYTAGALFDTARCPTPRRTSPIQRPSAPGSPSPSTAACGLRCEGETTAFAHGASAGRDVKMPAARVCATTDDIR